MKNYLKAALLFSMLFTIKVNAQNYSPIVSGDAIFSDDNNLLQLLHVDSIKADLKGLAHYLLKTVDISSQNNCLPYVGSWSGSKIIVASADTYYLFNANEDTITLQPAKELNIPWTLFKYSNGDYIEANVSLKEQLLFLGITDSVKTISLQLKNTSGTNLSSAINSFTLKLSKNYGFVSIPNISKFPNQLNALPLIGLTSPATGLQNITAADINNFSISDEFHYDEAESNPPSGTGVFTKRMQVVLSIRISANTDTVIYKMKNRIERQTIDWPTNAETTLSKIDTIEKRYLLHQPVYYPEQAISNDYYLGEKQLYPYGEKLTYHYTLRTNTNYNDRILIETDNQGPIYNGTCWTNILYNPVEVYSYAYGIGLTKREALSTGVSQSYEKLVYFKKGSEIWGTPLTLSNYSKVHDAAVALFPNPLKQGELLHLQTENFHTKGVIVYNAIGTRIKETHETASTIQFIDLSELQPGLYVIQLLNEKNEFITSKLLIK